MNVKMFYNYNTLKIRNMHEDILKIYNQKLKYLKNYDYDRLFNINMFSISRIVRNILQP